MHQNASSIGYFPQLDGIRAFAVFGVIAEHWAYLLPDYGLPAVLRRTIHAADLGGLGVECFFVLSGFLITLLLLNSKARHDSFKTSLGHFYVRRVLRIFPVYYATLIVLFFVYDQSHSVFGWHALYLSNLYPIIGGQFAPIGGHFWSLSIEEQFYLFWPLLVLLLSTRNLLVMSLILALLGPVSRIMLWTFFDGPHLLIATFPTTALDLLCFGGFLACLKQLGRLRAGSPELKILSVAGIASFLTYVVLYFKINDPALSVVLARTLSAIFFGALIVKAAAGFSGATGILLGNRMIIWFGTISYGLYIFHAFIPKMYLPVLHFLGLSSEFFSIYWVRFPLLLLLLLLITAISFYLFETPIRKLKVRFR